MPITLPWAVQKCIYVALGQAEILHWFGSQIYYKLENYQAILPGAHGEYFKQVIFYGKLQHIRT